MQNDILNRFRAALTAGRVEDVRDLITHEPIAREHVDAPIFAFGARPLSVGKRSDEMADLLIEYGANVNARSEWWAGSWGLLDDADDVVARRLIARGATLDVHSAAHLDDLATLTELLDTDPSLVHSKGGDGCRPLHFARSEAAIDLLLSRGADIDARDVDHTSTAAQWNVRKPDARNMIFPGELDRARWLVARGTTIDVFMLAALGEVDRLQALLDTDPGVLTRRVNDKDYPPCPVGPGEHIYTYKLGAGTLPHQVAADFGNAAVLELLLDRSPPAVRFIVACTTGDADRARLMAANDRSLLSQLTYADAAALPHAASRGKAEVVRLLLELGIDPTTPGANGASALHWAAWHGWAAVVYAILSHVAIDPRRNQIVNGTEPTFNVSPLAWCYHGSTNCRNPHGDYVAVARALLAAGATPVSSAEASDEIRAAAL